MPRFLKSERLRHTQEFKKVFQRCRKYENECFAFYIQHHSDVMIRKYGISIGRAYGKAHLRNLLKRQMREIYRVEREQFQGGYSMILLPKKICSKVSFHELKKAFQFLAQKAGLYSRTKTIEGSDLTV
jgi:ribonuclease P protein component